MFTYDSLVIVVLSKKCVDPPNLRTTPRLTKSLIAHTFQGLVMAYKRIEQRAHQRRKFNYIEFLEPNDLEDHSEQCKWHSSCYIRFTNLTEINRLQKRHRDRHGMSSSTVDTASTSQAHNYVRPSRKYISAVI